MRSKGKCYLAGPMRGLPEFNYPAFHHGAAMLRSWGWEVFSPAEKDAEEGVEVDENGVPTLAFMRKAMYTDLAYVTLEADAVFLLPDWENSSGARAEVAAAQCIGIEVVKPEYWYNAEPSVDGKELRMFA